MFRPDPIKRLILRQRRRAQRGSVAVLAIVALAVTLVFVLIVADTAINARMASSRQATQASLRALTANKFTTQLGAQNGIADLNAPQGALVGVFLGPKQPNLAAAPAMLSFKTKPDRDYLTLAPLLQQPFFIGPGVTSKGTQQAIIIPTGATRLYLGAMDDSGWWQNNGSFNVTIRPVP